MEKYDSLKNRIFVLIISLTLNGILIMLFFFDNSHRWNAYKIGSCIIVNLWLFFIIPAVRNSYLINKEKPLTEWFKMGFEFGASGIVFPILLAPYYGIKYYI